MSQTSKLALSLASEHEWSLGPLPTRDVCLRALRVHRRMLGQSKLDRGNSGVILRGEDGLALFENDGTTLLIPREAAAYHYSRRQRPKLSDILWMIDRA